MTEQDFVSRLRQVSLRVAKVICTEDSWTDFVTGLDSQTFIELVITIEQTFGISIPDEDLSHEVIANICVLRRLIDNLVQQ